jgi:hypothetical protein
MGGWLSAKPHYRLPDGCATTAAEPQIPVRNKGIPFIRTETDCHATESFIEPDSQPQRLSARKRIEPVAVRGRHARHEAAGGSRCKR